MRTFKVEFIKSEIVTRANPDGSRNVTHYPVGYVMTGVSEASAKRWERRGSAVITAEEMIAPLPLPPEPNDAEAEHLYDCVRYIVQNAGNKRVRPLVYQKMLEIKPEIIEALEFTADSRMVIDAAYDELIKNSKLVSVKMDDVKDAFAELVE